MEKIALFYEKSWEIEALYIYIYTCTHSLVKLDKVFGIVSCSLRMKINKIKLARIINLSFLTSDLPKSLSSLECSSY